MFFFFSFPIVSQVTRVLCGGACMMLLVSAAASVAVGFVRHHYRQQELIKITAVVQLAAGIWLVLSLQLARDWSAQSESLFRWNHGPYCTADDTRLLGIHLLYCRRREKENKNKMTSPFFSGGWQKQAGHSRRRPEYKWGYRRRVGSHPSSQPARVSRKDLSKGVQTTSKWRKTDPIFHHSSVRKGGRCREEVHAAPIPRHWNFPIFNFKRKRGQVINNSNYPIDNDAPLTKNQTRFLWRQRILVLGRLIMRCAPVNKRDEPHNRRRKKLSRRTKPPRFYLFTCPWVPHAI